jgi:hypothetical protein
MNHLGDHGRMVERFDIARLSKDKQRLLKPLFKRGARDAPIEYLRWIPSCRASIAEHHLGGATMRFSR